MEAEVARQRLLVKDILYPYLLKNTKSIVEAKRLCYEVQTALTQSFQKAVSDYQKVVSESLTKTLKIEDITKRGDEFKLNKKLYDLFADETVTVTNALLGGMSAALDSFVQEEIAGRHLSTLKTEFL